MGLGFLCQKREKMRDLHSSVRSFISLCLRKNVGSCETLEGAFPCEKCGALLAGEQHSALRKYQRLRKDSYFVMVVY